MDSWSTYLFACTGVGQPVHSHVAHVVHRGQAMAYASAPFHHGRFDCEVLVPSLFVFVTVYANAYGQHTCLHAQVLGSLCILMLRMSFLVDRPWLLPLPPSTTVGLIVKF